MDVREVEEKKKHLEQNISEMISDFERLCGVRISECYMRPGENGGSHCLPPKVVVRVTI